jgi:hypothetical protein
MKKFINFEEWKNSKYRVNESDDEDEDDEDVEDDDYEPMPQWDDEEIKKMRKKAREYVQKHKIDKIDIESVEHQYRINGCTSSLKLFSKGKEVPTDKGVDWDEDFAYALFPESFRKRIVNEEDIPVSEITKLLPGVKVFYEGKEMSEDDEIYVGQNSDS